MIEIKNLSKTYGKQKVVDDLSLTIPTGTIFGFLGPNGAGKTTAMKILVGINRPDTGQITIEGKDPSMASTREIIGFMPEEPGSYNQLTGLELIKFVNNLFNKNKQSSVDELENLLKKVGIYEARHKKIKNYSKGMKQRLGFAQALVNNPTYLFLDEPLEGLDPIGRREIKIILEELKKQGKTIFFSSHILEDIERVCDRIGMLVNGVLRRVIDFKNEQLVKSLEDTFIDEVEKAGGLQQ